MEHDNKSFFWPGYVDLMTGLFAVALVLFIFVFKYFGVRESRREAEIAELEKTISQKDSEITELNKTLAGVGEMAVRLQEFERLESINEAIENIDKDYFDYNEIYKKHILKIDINYPVGKFSINDITDQNARNNLINAGNKIIETIKRLNEDASKSKNVKYLVVIEGQASADNYFTDDYFNNDVLSYLRAQKLKEFWIKDNNIRFNELGNCELLVSGSGESGVPREIDERMNQRFLVHIVPVIGK